MNLGAPELLIILARRPAPLRRARAPEARQVPRAGQKEFKKGVDERGRRRPARPRAPEGTPQPTGQPVRASGNLSTPVPSFLSMADGVPTWEEVARDHGRFLYNVAYRLTGNDDDAQDLVQESAHRVRKGLERYEPGSLEGWLARIVTNVFLDEVRRRKRAPDRGAARRSRPRAAPDARRRRGAPTGLSDEIQRALGSMPEEFRVPVVLCDVGDLSYEQIAGCHRGADRHRPVAHPPRPPDAARPPSSPTG